MLIKLRDASDEINKNRVNSINEKLTEIKNIVKKVPKNDKLKMKRTKK